MKNITIFYLKIIFFKAVKNCSISHGRVFVIDVRLYFIIQREQAFFRNKFVLNDNITISYMLSDGL